MTSPTIRQLSPYRFSVVYEGHDPLLLDFAPLAAAALGCCPCEDFVLQHWQARPRGLRQFGVFTKYRDGSTSYQVRRSAPASRAAHYPLQVEEGAFVPSAALFYPGALLAGNGEIYQYKRR